MTTQQLFYRSVVPVSAQRHGNWSVKSGDSFAFAAGVNSVPLTAVEFDPASAEYPVVFAASGDSVFPAAILGARPNENLYVDGAGKWLGRYVPAFVRRYPFVFSQDEAGTTFTLNIDESFAGCNQDGRGERLFDADGQQTQYLQGVLAFLQDYQARIRRTRAYCDRLKELNLLQPMQAQFTLASGEQRSIAGFMAVDRQKLKALPADVLADMMSKDELECTFLHLASLRHFRDMLDRMPAAAAAAAAPQPAPAEPPPAEPGVVH
ncbi:SapC family protein [Falsiroseomonas oryzae]|uniref:SapC family protein n=1 Tax=Falsiroseomonas oryzae TaxID=2766473 RepID=UPI0022EAA669|nr:SapC family protein [Roseomonas sp. MO-31]